MLQKKDFETSEDLNERAGIIYTKTLKKCDYNSLKKTNKNVAKKIEYKRIQISDDKLNKISKLSITEITIYLLEQFHHDIINFKNDNENFILREILNNYEFSFKNTKGEISINVDELPF
jgi:hypothetical protein